MLKQAAVETLISAFESEKGTGDKRAGDCAAVEQVDKFVQKTVQDVQYVHIQMADVFFGNESRH